jgi:hypothetical protein
MPRRAKKKKALLLYEKPMDQHVYWGASYRNRHVVLYAGTWYSINLAEEVWQEDYALSPTIFPPEEPEAIRAKG